MASCSGSGGFGSCIALMGHAFFAAEALLAIEVTFKFRRRETMPMRYCDVVTTSTLQACLNPVDGTVPKSAVRCSHGEPHLKIPHTLTKTLSLLTIKVFCSLTSWIANGDTEQTLATPASSSLVCKLWASLFVIATRNTKWERTRCK